jgi:hypothetical protein
VLRFRQKYLSKNIGFFDSKLLSLRRKQRIVTLFLREKRLFFLSKIGKNRKNRERHFFCRKWAKIAKNSYHNICSRLTTPKPLFADKFNRFLLCWQINCFKKYHQIAPIANVTFLLTNRQVFVNFIRCRPKRDFPPFSINSATPSA